MLSEDLHKSTPIESTETIRFKEPLRFMGTVEKVKTDIENFDLTQIPYEALRRLVIIFKEGEVKYGRGNWRNGQNDRTWQLERANHALKHLLLHIHQLETGECLTVVNLADEDDLAKVMWYCAIKSELERMEKHA